MFFFLAVLVMRLIRRFLLPLIFKKASEKVFSDMESRMRNSRQDMDGRKEGEVRVESNAKKQEQRVEEGDYVEYEEF